MARFSASRRPREGKSLTAAVQRVTDPKLALKASLMPGPGGNWQKQASEYARNVGELRYYVSWRASSASRCRLIASDIDPDTGKPAGGTENETVKAIVRDIGGGITGQSRMLHRLTALLTVVGEGWYGMLVRDSSREKTPGGLAPILTAEEGAEEWFTFSREEIITKGREIILILPDGIQHTFDPVNDILLRIWNPDLEKAHLPDSPVRANFAALNEIVRATAAIDNASQSRLIGNGIVFVPQEMSLPGSKPGPAAVPIEGEIAPVPPVPAAGEAGELQDLLYEVATTAVKDPHSQAALVPIIVSAPGDMIKNVQHIKFGTDVSETAMKTRDKSVERLARGLETSPERLLGMGTNSNHWGQWAIGEDDIKVHIAPPVEIICDALNRGILREKAAAAGIDPDTVTIWYDTNELTQDPDKKDEAQTAYDRGALTSTALRTHLGFSDEDGYRLDTREGWLQLAMDRSAQDPSLIPLFAGVLGKLADGIGTPPAIEPGAGAPPAAGAPAPEEEPQTGPEPPPEPSRTAAAYSFARICAANAMGIANKRRRNRSNHQLFDGELPIDQAHIRLGPTTDAARLIEGWDSVLHDEDIATFGFDRPTLATLILACATDALGTSRAWTLTPADVAKAMR